MLKKLILIVDNEKFQFDTLKELVETIIDKNYYELSLEEQKKKLELKAFANCIQDKIEVLTEVSDVTNIDGKFVAIDEISYLYSLMILNRVFILESTNSNILINEVDKSHITDNYIVINTFAKELLKKYINKFLL